MTEALFNQSTFGPCMSKRRQTVRKAIVYLSLALFPVFFYYLSPALILQGASEGVVNGSFIVFSLLLLGSVFLGRLWCGWLCPGAGMGELCLNVRKGRVRTGRWDLIKLLVWVPWIVLIAVLAITSEGYHKVDPLYQTVWGISILAPGAIFIMVGVLSLIGGLDLIVGRRAFCHYACWMAPFTIMGTWVRDRLRFPWLRLRAKPEKCIHCGACTRNCPMSLDVQEMVRKGDMRHSECVMCLTCVDGCPTGAITFGR